MTQESFVSIGWRLIPYWLNNWEQQWGAECSSMVFELPHFALELLVVLPCVQVRGGEAGSCDEPNACCGERIQRGDLVGQVGPAEHERELIERKAEPIRDVAEGKRGVGQSVEESSLECHDRMIPNKTKTARGLFGYFRDFFGVGRAMKSWDRLATESQSALRKTEGTYWFAMRPAHST